MHNQATLESEALRRLFSTFAQGWPGAGLLFLRLVAGGAVMARALTMLGSGTTSLGLLAMALGILLLAGLWTPVTGSLVAALGVWYAISRHGDLWANILLGAVGAALALIGPGAWSVDARLFGWRRIDVRDRDSQFPPS